MSAHSNGFKDEIKKESKGRNGEMARKDQDDAPFHLPDPSRGAFAAAFLLQLAECKHLFCICVLPWTRVDDVDDLESTFSTADASARDIVVGAVKSP